MIGIGFSTKKKNILSRIIRDATGGQFSHTWPVYDHPIYKKRVVVDATIPYILEVDYENYDVDNPVILVPPEGVDLSPGMPALSELLARPYGILNLIGHGIVILFSKLGKRIRNPFTNPAEPACIETSFVLVHGAGILKEVDAEEESPQSLYEKLVGLGWTRLP